MASVRAASSGWEDVDADGQVVVDTELDEDELNDTHITFTETQMTLPSGAKIGSRQYRTYWSQNIRPSPVVPGSASDPEMIARSFGTALIKRDNHGRVMTVEQIRENKVKTKEIKRQLIKGQDFRARVGFSANGLQTHYREQNPF